MKTLSDVVDEVHKNGANGLSKGNIEAVLKAGFASIALGISTENEVRINGFGTFTKTERASREGRNPATGATITLKASTSVKFKPSKTLKDQVA